MSTVTTSPTATDPVRSTPARTGVTFPRVVASEWVKLRSLRSTWWTLAVTVVVMAGVGLLVAWATSLMVDDVAAEGISVDAGGQGVSLAVLVTAGLYFAQLAVAVLGVLAVTGEYSTGMIRSTLAAVPTRLPALAAKAVVLAVLAVVTSIVGVLGVYLVTLPFHGRLGLAVDLGDADTLRILGGAPLYLAAVALLALGFGALLRHSAGALASVLGLMLVVETVFAMIPLTAFRTISAFLPITAGGRLLTESDALAMAAEFSEGPQLTPWQGYGVLVAWAVVILGVAAVLLRRRDA